LVSLYIFNSKTASPSGVKARRLHKEQYPDPAENIFGPDIKPGRTHSVPRKTVGETRKATAAELKLLSKPSGKFKTARVNKKKRGKTKAKKPAGPSTPLPRLKTSAGIGATTGRSSSHGPSPTAEPKKNEAGSEPGSSSGDSE